MYIRTKEKSKKNGGSIYYAYLVHSKRRYKKPRQKTLKYLGKIIDFTTHSNTPILIEDKQQYISNKDYKEIIQNLVKNEIAQLGFQEINNDLFLKGELKLDLKTFNFQDKHKNPFVIKLNNGFLCKYTLNKLINFKFENKTEKECINLFANQLVSTGINMDKELFILLFKKIYPYNN